jgi:hypothetical protein
MQAANTWKKLTERLTERITEQFGSVVARQKIGSMRSAHVQIGY